MSTALRFLPPLAWSALIAWFSGAGFGADTTGPILGPWLRAIAPWASPEQVAALHWLVRKVGHVTEYAVLALLWSRALSGGPALVGAAARRPWRGAFVLAALTASLDEAHQATTATREGSLADVLLDIGAAAAALVVAALGSLAVADRLARLLLWIAAGGGTILLAIDVAAAAPSGWLWLSVPAAWLALWYWRRGRA